MVARKRQGVRKPPGSGSRAWCVTFDCSHTQMRSHQQRAHTYHQPEMLLFNRARHAAIAFAVGTGLLSALGSVTAGATIRYQQNPEAPDRISKNVILFIADGFGPAGVTLAREYQASRQQPFVLSSILLGTVSTASVSSRITDSAASGTALAAGTKTKNGLIAMDSDLRPVRTILEAAEDLGMSTGLVATSSITHATPAAFSSHVPDRGMQQEIAEQQINAGIEVLLGGGLSDFLPENKGGARSDDRNLLKEAAMKGYKVVTSPLTLDKVEEAPVLGLFSFGHMQYEIDRVPETQPSIEMMTRKALGLLSQDEDGFFLMVEASRIDHAAHLNDPIAHLHDILAYERALDLALQFAGEHPGTLVVSTSDHETGGLALGRDGVYSWDPEVLGQATSSVSGLVNAVRDGGPIGNIIRKGLGIDDLTSMEEDRLRRAHSEGSIEDFTELLSELINSRAGLGWSTTGHSAVDVHLGAFGAGSTYFVGHHDNDELGRLLAKMLNVEVGLMSSKPAAAGAPG